ncbi:MAG: prepilin-type N-terminal cleavage/methylation domain-containing protein [bacterium]|nr:prepilin-type N-terminal cleavage/methylation domain-containing protein [bacterium]
MQKGFTLVEVLAASFIITLGAGGAFALVQRTISFTTNAVSQLEATYLAQEGIEIARNIRDTNLLKIHKGAGGEWTDNLTGCESGCEGAYSDQALVSFQDRLLRRNAGLYNYAAGQNTSFKRKITITQPGDEVLDVVVEVTWTERTRSHELTAATQLYNWLPEIEEEP